MSDRTPVYMLDPSGASDGDGPVYDAASGRVIWAAPASGGPGVEAIVAGTGITVDSTDPTHPVVSATGGGGGGTAAQAYAGKNGIGASTEAMVNRRIFLKQITLSQPGLLTDVEAYITANGNVHGLAFGLWADSSGAPDKLLGFTTYPPDKSLYLAAASAWVSGGMGRWLVAGTYWIGVQFRLATGGTSWTLAYDSSGTDRTFTPGGDWIQGLNGATTTAASRDYSIRANVITL